MNQKKKKDIYDKLWLVFFPLNLPFRQEENKHPRFYFEPDLSLLSSHPSFFIFQRKGYNEQLHNKIMVKRISGYYPIQEKPQDRFEENSVYQRKKITERLVRTTTIGTSLSLLSFPWCPLLPFRKRGGPKTAWLIWCTSIGT